VKRSKLAADPPPTSIYLPLISDGPPAVRCGTPPQHGSRRHRCNMDRHTARESTTAISHDVRSGWYWTQTADHL